MHDAQCTMHDAWCTMHNAWCTMNNAWCMMHDAWCMMHNAQCMIHDAWCMMHNAWCMMHDAQCTMHDAWCMMHDAQCMIHDAWQPGCTTACSTSVQLVLLLSKGILIPPVSVQCATYFCQQILFVDTIKVNMNAIFLNAIIFICFGFLIQSINKTKL